ncbi:hypothetical protein SBADM41S_03320 [Streptomyces badius]
MISHQTKASAHHPYTARLWTIAAGIIRKTRKSTASRLSGVGRTSICTG